DYLAIQGSATPSKCAFSSGGITGCAQRSQLQPNVFEGLQLLKSAYWNGNMSAGTQLALHTEAVFAMSLMTLMTRQTSYSSICSHLYTYKIVDTCS
ncbi:hypothetical protein EI94DRAFT_1650866, partial [Lactarius quietus]